MRLAPVMAAVFLSGLASGQPPAAKPAFEVVSIKPGSDEPLHILIQSGKMRSRITDARVDFGSISLSVLIQLAFRMPQERISGPNWMEDANFDVLAKLPDGSSRDQVPEMLQRMLVDRFKLAYHYERKDMPAYDLVIGKGTLRLVPSTTGDPQQAGCTGGRDGQHDCRGMTMQNLADMLTRVSFTRLSLGGMTWAVDRPVVDMTGLAGTYDFAFEYGRLGGRGGGVDPAVAGELAMADGLRKLGLNLAPRRHTFEILVIDRVERVPSEN